MEYAGSSDGIFFDNNSKDEWISAILQFIDKREFFFKQEIAYRASERFSPRRIGIEYMDILNNVLRPNEHFFQDANAETT